MLRFGGAEGGEPSAPAARVVERDPQDGSDGPSLDWRSAAGSVMDHWFLALTAATLTVAVGAFVVLKKFAPVYRAESVLYVRPTAPSLAYTGEEWRAESIASFYGDYVRTLEWFAVDPKVLDEAIGRLARRGVEWLPAGVERDDAAHHLRARLDISHISGSHLMKIGLTDGAPGLPSTVVNAVTEVLLEKLQEENLAGTNARLETLTREKRRLKEDLGRNQANLDELAGSTGVAVLDESQNVFYERLVRLQDGVTDVFVERVRAEGQLQEDFARARDLRKTFPVGELERLVDQDQAVAAARLQFHGLSRQIEEETVELSESHPGRIRAGETLRAAQLRLAELERDVRERLRERIHEERSEAAHELMLGSMQRLGSAQRNEARMSSELATAELRLSEYAKTIQRSRALRAESDRLLEAIGRVDTRIEEVIVEMLLAVVLMVAAGAGVGAALLRDAVPGIQGELRTLHRPQARRAA
jgi:capsular polysaccharide biosynthesis protein